MSSSFLEKIYDTQKKFILSDSKSFKTPKSYYNKFSNIKYSKNMSPRFKIKFTNFYNEFIDNDNNNYNNIFYNPNKNYYNTITNFNNYNLNIKKNKPIDTFNYQISLKNIIKENQEKQKKINIKKNNFYNFSPEIKIKLNYKKKYLKDYLDIKNNFNFEQTESRINKMKKKKIYQPKKLINLNIKKNKKFNIFNKKIFGDEDNTFLNNDNRLYSSKFNIKYIQ